MKKMSKTDRYILIGSIGILLISTIFTFDKLLRQNLKKEQIKVTQQETLITETLNIKIWRRYHEDQMILMHEILKELKYQNNDHNHTLTRNHNNIKVNFQK